MDTGTTKRVAQHVNPDESAAELSTEQPWSRKRLRLGLRVFVFLTLGVLFVLFLRGNIRDSFDALLVIPPLAIGIGLAQSLIDLLGGGLRLWFVSRAFGAGSTLLQCVRANGANVFVGGLTPSQTGGGPAQIYVLARSGMGLPIALVTSFLAYMGTILALLGFGLVMVWSGPPRIIDDGYGPLLKLGATFLGSFLVLLLLALPRPGIYRTLLQRSSARFPWLARRLGPGSRWSKIGYTLDVSSSLLRRTTFRGALLIALGFVMTLVVYVNKFAVAYFAIRAMGIEATFLDVIFLQWVLYLVLYFAPTPGASGLAEISALAIMGPLVPAAQFGAFVVLWRLFSLYVPMAVSGILLMSRDANRKKQDDGHGACHAGQAGARVEPTGLSFSRCSAVAAVLGMTLLWTSPGRAENLPTDPPAGCTLCRGPLSVPVVRLTKAWLDSLAGERARFNTRQIARVDSLLSSGRFGRPSHRKSRQRANLVARLTTINAYRDLAMLATDSTTVYEADEAALAELTAHYSDAILFAAARLEGVRLGLGRVCLRYAVREYAHGESDHGGRTLRWRVEDAVVDGERRRLLHVDLPTGTDDVVEVLLAPHHSFAVEHLRMQGPPARYEWFIVHNIEGGWLRKWGTHRPTAYMFWVSPIDTALEGIEELPDTPLVGVRIYIPGLKLRIPLVPDINFDDLREIELPMPILAVEDLERDRLPHWLISKSSDFKDWKGHGPVPPDIRLRFPDL